MIRPAIQLSVCLFLAVPGSAHADRLALPIGEWGYSSNHGVNCKPAFLKIEKDRIVKRLGGGEGRCLIKSIKREGKVLFVSAPCEYGKSVPQDYLIEGDGDDDSFSLAVKSPTRILFNNTPYELCQPNSGDGK